MEHKTFTTTTRSSADFFRSRQQTSAADFHDSLQGFLHELRVAIQAVQAAAMRSPSALVTTRYGFLADVGKTSLEEDSRKDKYNLIKHSHSATWNENNHDHKVK